MNETTKGCVSAAGPYTAVCIALDLPTNLLLLFNTNLFRCYDNTFRFLAAENRKFTAIF